jgi:hypothetical protein
VGVSYERGTPVWDCRPGSEANPRTRSTSQNPTESTPNQIRAANEQEFVLEDRQPVSPDGGMHRRLSFVVFGGGVGMVFKERKERNAAA